MNITVFLFRPFGVLCLFGLVHMVLLWNGDILMLYAFCGLVTIPLLSLRTPTLAIMGVLLTLGSSYVDFPVHLPGEEALAVLEELGSSHLPIPNSFPQSLENSEYSYNFFITATEGVGTQAHQPWTAGPAPDGKGRFSTLVAQPLGEEPNLAFGRPDTFGQKEQSNASAAGLVSKVKDLVDRS